MLRWSLDENDLKTIHVLTNKKKKKDLGAANQIRDIRSFLMKIGSFSLVFSCSDERITNLIQKLGFFGIGFGSFIKTTLKHISCMCSVKLPSRYNELSFVSSIIGSCEAIFPSEFIKYLSFHVKIRRSSGFFFFKMRFRVSLNFVAFSLIKIDFFQVFFFRVLKSLFF